MFTKGGERRWTLLSLMYLQKRLRQRPRAAGRSRPSERLWGGYLVSAELVQPWRSAQASAKVVPSPVSAALATAIPVPLLVHVPLAPYPAAIRVSPTSARMGRSSIPAPVSALAQPA